MVKFLIFFIYLFNKNKTTTTTTDLRVLVCALPCPRPTQHLLPSLAAVSGVSLRFAETACSNPKHQEPAGPSSPNLESPREDILGQTEVMMNMLINKYTQAMHTCGNYTLTTR